MFPGKSAPVKACAVGVAPLASSVEHVLPSASLHYMRVRVGGGADTDRHIAFVHQDPEPVQRPAGREVKSKAVGTHRYSVSPGVERIPAVSVIGNGGRP